MRKTCLPCIPGPCSVTQPYETSYCFSYIALSTVGGQEGFLWLFKSDVIKSVTCTHNLHDFFEIVINIWWQVTSGNDFFLTAAAIIKMSLFFAFGNLTRRLKAERGISYKYSAANLALSFAPNRKTPMGCVLKYLKAYLKQHAACLRVLRFIRNFLPFPPSPPPHHHHPPTS